MCLSTVYKNTVTPETVAMKNVMKIECQGDMVILTDLMERQMAIHGELVMANLVEGVAVVREVAGSIIFAQKHSKIASAYFRPKRFFCGAPLRTERSRAAGPRT